MKKTTKEKEFHKKVRRQQRKNFILSIPTKPKAKSKIKIFGVALWKVIIGAILIATGIVAFIDIKKVFLNPKEIYDKETFIEGDLKPAKLNIIDSFEKISNEGVIRFSTELIKDTLPVIKGILIKDFIKSDILVIMGNSGRTYARDDYYTGIDVLKSLKKCIQKKIILGVKDDRLYVSCEFKDLQNEQTIGVIEFNHWKLYKANMFDFISTDDKLEVIDKQHHIVLSIGYIVNKNNSQCLYIDGYFIDPTSILVLRGHKVLGKEYENCFLKSDKNWKQKAELAIESIKSAF